MIKNRRKHAASRTKMGNCRAFILQGKQRILIKLADRALGGIGIVVSTKTLLQLNVKVGQKMRVQFPLCGTNHADLFIVCSISKNRIGLQYADGKYLSPQQRSIVGYNT